MSKIYVPEKSSYACYVVRNDTTIRAYEEIPRNNRDVNYRDYFYTANYTYQDGVQTFSNYTTLPICLSQNDITSDVYYRNDFDKILIIFLIMCIFCFYIPLKIFVRLFRRFQ